MSMEALAEQNTAEELIEKIKSKKARVGVTGLGYVGLPLASLCARRGFTTVGIDVDKNKVQQLNGGNSYIQDVDSSHIAQFIREHKLCGVWDWSKAGDLDVVVLCVPTPFGKNKEPDLSYVVSAIGEVARIVRRGMLIVLESSTYPGTVEEILMPEIERSGLKVGRDIYLAYAPERIDPGNLNDKIESIPRIVGGITAICGRVATVFYQELVTKVVTVSSTRVAEMAKLLENIFRNVNIALVKELAMLCDRMKIDIWEAIEAASTKPFGFMRFQPGPGVGGHCIPVDPIYLAWKAREWDFHTNFINLASEINSNMPYFVTNKLLKILTQHSGHMRKWNILILGVTFKKDVADIRESSAIKLIELLQESGVSVAYHDPFIAKLSIKDDRVLESIELNEQSMALFDCTVIHTDHTSYDWRWIVDHSNIIFDTRNAARHTPLSRDKIFKL